MIRPLALLTWLQVRAMLRRAGKHFRKPLQAVITTGAAAILLLIFVPVMLFGSPPQPAARESIAAVAPVFILLFFASTLAAPKASLFFSPPTIQFLFAGPFSRRTVLGYRLALAVGGACLSAILMAVFLRMVVGSFGRAWVALSLISACLLLLNVLFTLAVIGIRQRWGSGALRACAALLGGLLLWLGLRSAGQFDGPALALALVDEGLVGFILLLRELTLVAVLVAPFDFLGQLLVARETFPLYALATAGLCAGLGLTAVKLPVDFREEVIRISRRIEMRKRRAETGQPAVGTFSFFRSGLPLLPAWGGAGPIAWRQLLLGVRRLPGILLLGTLVAAPGFFVYFRSGAEAAGIGMLLPPVFFLTFFMAGNGISCDFRADLRHMEVLKALPARPIAVACGQLLAPVLLLTVMQTAVIGAFSLLVPDYRWILAGAIAGLAVVNILFVGVENLGVLLFPAEQRPATTDPVAMARATLFGFVKFAVFGLLTAAIGGSAFLAFWLSGSVTLAVALALLLSALACSLLVWGVAAAFARLDVSSDLPG